MYTETELETASYLGLDPADIKGFETNPDLQSFVCGLVSLKEGDFTPQAEETKG